uniref:Ribosomal RNA small subunit methyltransferase G n=1 Tax=Noccaea caerulescens TaxID=107243 RepID=A0A1J3CST2_NOCCA
MLVIARPSVSHALSLGNFIKHFPCAKSHSFLSRRFYSSNNTHTIVAESTITSCFKSLTASQQNQIHLYVDTLLQWNQKMNLTATKDAEEVMERHIEDSLAILPPIKNCYSNVLFDQISLIDVGSGAGLPGLVLAIACPDWRVTLLESINKRCVFLEHVVNVTGLTNVEIARGRAESCGHDVMYREKFDVAIARAVAEMRVLAEYCLPLVRIGGLFVAPKGHDPKEEVQNAENAVRMLGGSILQIIPVDSHSPYGQRTTVVCRKDHSTPQKYPREAGTPSKLPL